MLIDFNIWIWSL